MATITCKQCGSSDYISNTVIPTSSGSALRCEKCGHEQTCTKAEWDQYHHAMFVAAVQSVIPEIRKKAEAAGPISPELADSFAVMDSMAARESKARSLRRKKLHKLDATLSRWAALSDDDKAQFKNEMHPKVGDFGEGSLYKDFLDPSEASAFKTLYAEWEIHYRKDAPTAIEHLRERIALVTKEMPELEKRQLLKSANGLFNMYWSVWGDSQLQEFRQLCSTLKSLIKSRWWEFWLK